MPPRNRNRANAATGYSTVLDDHGQENEKAALLDLAGDGLSLFLFSPKILLIEQTNYAEQRRAEQAELHKEAIAA